MRALITGITGQDGSYLAELLLDHGYQVFGLLRRSSNSSLERIRHLEGKIELLRGDLLDQTSLVRVLAQARPTEIYNLAAQSFVPTSWQEPVLTAEITALGVTRLLEAMRQAAPEARFYQASSSEIFGQAVQAPQNESTPFHPRSPYGVAKLYGHWITVNFRESFGLFACCGILFNHESPRRGEEFVTRKVSLAAARIRAGLQHQLELGNLEARRDWGFAGDYVEAMRRMLQRATPADYVVATGEQHSVRELVAIAFDEAGLDWRAHVVCDPKLIRPAEVDRLVGDASRARAELGWKPKVGFERLVRDMVRADLERIGHAARVPSSGALPPTTPGTSPGNR